MLVLLVTMNYEYLLPTTYHLQQTRSTMVDLSWRAWTTHYPPTLCAVDLRPPIPTHHWLGRAHTHPLSMGMGGYWVGTGYGYPVQDSALDSRPGLIIFGFFINFGNFPEIKV